jgi:hypothetical protein
MNYRQYAPGHIMPRQAHHTPPAVVFHLFCGESKYMVGIFLILRSPVFSVPCRFRGRSGRE